MAKNEYLAYMTEPANIRKCAECPENKGFENYSPDFKLPCGQQNCWVRLTCKAYGTLKEGC